MKSFRKFALIALAGVSLVSTLTSCATILGGRVTDNQKRRPMPGEPQRQVRTGALIADIMLFPLISIPVDFATGAIYKPKQQAVSQMNQATPSIATRQHSKQ